MEIPDELVPLVKQLIEDRRRKTLAEIMGGKEVVQRPRTELPAQLPIQQ